MYNIDICVNMYIYIYICTYIQMNIYIYNVYIYIYRCIYIYAYVYVSVYVNTCQEQDVQFQRDVHSNRSDLPLDVAANDHPTNPCKGFFSAEETLTPKP